MVGATAVAVLAACGGDDESGGATTAGGGDGGSGGTATGGTGTTAGGATPEEANHFRLSSRHSTKKPCNACTSHINNRFYATAEAAENDRPHEGCNCKVRGRVASDADLETYFGGGDRDVYDKRTD